MKTLIASILALSAAVTMAITPASAAFGPKDLIVADGPAFGPKDLVTTDGPAFGPSDLTTGQSTKRWNEVNGGNQR